MEWAGGPGGCQATDRDATRRDDGRNPASDGRGSSAFAGAIDHTPLSCDGGFSSTEEPPTADERNRRTGENRARVVFLSEV